MKMDSLLVKNISTYRFSPSIPVWIIRLKVIQFPGPVPSLSVIMFRNSALMQVAGRIGYAIAVHTPPRKHPILLNHDNDREITMWGVCVCVSVWLRYTVHYLSFSMPDIFLGWDFCISQSRIFHISVSSWILGVLHTFNQHTRTFK